MEFKYYSIDGEIREDGTVQILNNEVPYKVHETVGEFKDGKLVNQKKYTTIVLKDIADIVEWELKTKKSFEFYDKLRKKIETMLEKELNK